MAGGLLKMLRKVPEPPSGGSWRMPKNLNQTKSLRLPDGGAFILPSVGRVHAPTLRHTQSSSIALEGTIAHCNRPRSESATNSPSDCGTRSITGRTSHAATVARLQGHRRSATRSNARQTGTPRSRTDDGGQRNRIVGGIAADNWSEAGKLRLRLQRERPAGREVIFPARCTCVVGREEAWSAVAVVRLRGDRPRRR
jgi:hypothetical protein